MKVDEKRSCGRFEPNPRLPHGTFCALPNKLLLRQPSSHPLSWVFVRKVLFSFAFISVNVILYCNWTKHLISPVLFGFIACFLRMIATNKKWLQISLFSWLTTTFYVILLSFTLNHSHKSGTVWLSLRTGQMAKFSKFPESELPAKYAFTCSRQRTRSAKKKVRKEGKD